MVPEGWTEKRLDEASVVIDCKHRTPSYVPDGIPVISPGSISWGPLSLDSPRKVTQEEYEQLMDHCSVEPGDIVFSRNQSAGVGAYVANEEPFVLGQDTVLIKPKDYDARYLYLCMQSDLFRRQMFKLSGGSTFSRINLKELKRFKVRGPTRSEQRKIACILSTWDKAIATVEKLIENSKAQKKALMQQLLTGKRRLPGFTSCLWDICKLKELCEVRRGASPRPIDNPKWFSDEGRAWVRIADVTSSPTRFLNSTSQYLSLLGETRSVKVEPGELIMSICATIGVPRIVNRPACIHDGFVVFRKYEGEINTTFLYHFLNKETEKLASGGQPGTQKNLNTSIVGNIKIPKISLDEQKEIAAILTSAEEEITQLELRRSAFVTEKKALMQQLLTGKRRVKVDDA